MAKKIPADPEFTVEWVQILTGKSYVYHGFNKKRGIRLRISPDRFLTQPENVYLEEQQLIAEALDRQFLRLPVWCNLLALETEKSVVEYDAAVLALKKYAEELYGDNSSVPGYRSSDS